VKRILIVDDVETNRHVLAALLVRAGYEATAVGSAEAARRCVVEKAPDCLITDLNMPDEDGVTLARSLLPLARESGMRMALMSADEGGEAVPQGLFDAVLAKPVTLDALQAFIGA